MNGNGWKRIALVASTIVALGGAATVVIKFAPWAWASDLRIVATDSYTVAIAQQHRLIIALSAHLRNAKTAGDAALERKLLLEIRQMEDELRRLKAEKNKFQ